MSIVFCFTIYVHYLDNMLTEKLHIQKHKQQKRKVYLWNGGDIFFFYFFFFSLKVNETA